MALSDKRILVTGGAGLIGSHLCERLVAAGHEIACLDNFLSGSDRNIRLLLEHPRFSALRHDITQPLSDRRIITLARSKLAWSPNVPLREGLRRTVKYFQN